MKRIIKIKYLWTIVLFAMMLLNSQFAVHAEDISSENRHLVVSYTRPEADYRNGEDGWSLWAWEDGYEGTDYLGEVHNGKLIFDIQVSSECEKVGILLHRTEDGDAWVEKDGEDFFVEFPIGQNIKKVNIEQGEIPVVEAPDNQGVQYSRVKGELKFYYRDDTHYYNNTLESLRGKVNVEVGGGTYVMTYDEVNKRFEFTASELLNGKIYYRYIVDGKTALDPYNAAQEEYQGETYSYITLGIVEFNGHYYKLIEPGMIATWEQAAEYCESLGGYMATISSQAENDFLYNHVKISGYQNAYFGYTDLLQEGDWQWVKDEGSNYTNWADGEPNNLDLGEHYAMFYWEYPDGRWNDGDFQGASTYNDDLAFICEWEDNTLCTFGTQYLIKVVDSEGKAIPGASVTVTRIGKEDSYITDDRGYVVFDKLSLGNIDITITADKYESYTTVGKNYKLNENDYEVFVLYGKEEAGLKLTEAIYQDTNANYNEVIGMDVNLIKGTKRLSLTNASAGYFRIYCKTSNASVVNNYILYQNGNIIKVSENGVFDLRIADFKAGKNIYVTTVGNDGKKVSTPLNLEICDDQCVGKFNVSFAEELSVGIPDDIPFIGGSKLEMDIPDLPLQIEFENGKIYAAVNLKLDKEPENAEGNKNTLEKQMKEINEAIDEVKRLSKYKVGKGLKGSITKFLKKKKEYKLPVVGDVEAALFGAGEVTWSDRGCDEIKLQLYFMLDVSAEKTWQTMVWVIPVTVNIEVGAEAKVEATATWDNKAKSLNGDVVLNLKPYLNPFGGVGVGKHLAIGVYGNAEAEMQIQLLGTTIKPGLNYVDLTGTLGLKAYAGPFVYEKAFAHKTWHPYTRTDALAASTTLLSKQPYFASMYDSNQYAIGNVSYLADESEWLGETTGVQLFSTTDIEKILEINPLVCDTYRNLQPSIANTSDTVMMTYIGADKNREAQNMATVMYSVYDAKNATWGQPAQLDRNQTADNAPYIFSDGANIRIAYQDATVSYSDAITEEEYLKTQSIVVALYNRATGKFDIEKTITSAEEYYRAPKLTTVSGIPVLVWIAGKNTDILGQGAQNKILYSVYEAGAWSEPKVLAENISTICEFSVGSRSDVLEVMYVSDADNNLSTETDKSLQIVNADGSNSIATGLVGNLDFVKLPSEQEMSFIWILDGKLYVLDEAGKAKEVCNVGNAESLTVFSDKILFTNATKEGSEIFTVAYNSESGVYSAMVQSSEQNQYIEKIDGVNFNNDEILTMVRKTIEINETVEDVSELSWAILNNKPNLKISSVNCNYSELTETEVLLKVAVDNNGTKNAEGYWLTVKDSTGTVLVSKKQETVLAVGETADIVINIPRENITSVSKIQVCVMETEEKESDHRVFEIGYADLALNTEIVKVGNHNTMLCTVVNEGLTGTAAELLVCGENEDSIIVYEEIENLLPSEKRVFAVDLAGEALGGVLHCSVKSNTKEYSEVNNIETIYVDMSLFEEKECVHEYVVEEIPSEGNQAATKKYSCVCGKTYYEGEETESQETTSQEETTEIVQSDYFISVAGLGLFAKDWAPADPSGRMKEISAGVWELKLTGVKKGTYEYKYTYNGEWSHDWGADGIYRGDNCILDVVNDGSIIIFKVDLSKADMSDPATVYQINASVKVMTEENSSKDEETTDKKEETTETTEPGSQETTTKAEEVPTESLESSNQDETTESEETTTESQETSSQEELTTEKSEETTTGQEETTTEKPEETTTSQEETTTKPEQVKQRLTNLSIAVSSYTYDGYAKKPTPTVKCGTKKLTKDKDYKATYKNNVNPGTATVTVTGIGTYTGTLTKTFKINLSKVTSLKQNTSYTTSKITMAWNKVKGATGYEIYRAASKNSSYKLLKTVTANSYTQSGLKAAVKYYYKVRAYKTVNGKKVYGAYSEAKSMITKPAAPTMKLTAGSKRVKVSWTKASGSNGYEVYMATSRNGSYTKIKSANSLQLHYTKTGLTKGKTYYFKVRAFKKTGVGVKVYSGYSRVSAVKVK